MAIIYSYPSSTPLLSDLMIISRTPTNPNETANYSISLQDLAGLLSGTGTVTNFSATSTIPGITTTVATASSTPSLTIGIAGTPAAGTYLDNTGNFTTPAGGGGGGGTLQQVLQAGNVTGNNKMFAQGGASGGINLADDTVLTLGTGNDLSIKHNSVGGESEILETGTGGLTITGSSTITFKAGVAGDTYAVFNDNGAVSLRYDNVVKFETTTNGIKVTDRIEASTTNTNLQVQGNGTGFLEVRSADGVTAGKIQINNAANSQSIGIQAPTLASSYVLTLPTTDGGPTEVLSTDGNGVLSWVTNAGGGSGITGTGVANRATFWTGASTVSSDDAFLWDSTTNRLGIGTAAPLQAIDVTGAGKYYGLNGKAFASTTSTTADPMQIGDISGAGFPLQLLDNTGTSVLHVTDGKIGIATTTPSEKLQVTGNLRVTGAFLDSNNTTGTAGQVLSSTGSATDWIPNLTLTTNGTSGAATLNATTRVLNIPQYSGGGGGGMTSFNLAGDTGTQQTISDSDTLSVLGGTYLATVASNTDTLTINHDATTRTNTTSSESPAAGGTFDVIDTLTTNTTGHVTAVNTKTVTLPASGDTYDLNAGPKVGINVPLNLTSGSGSDNSLVTLTEGSGVTLTRNSATQITIASSGGGGGATDINGLSDGFTNSSSLGLGSINMGSGTSNTIVGQDAAQGSGSFQTFTVVGHRAAKYLSTGSLSNTAIGYEALAGTAANPTSVTNNVAVGDFAMSSVTSSATHNTAIGNSSLTATNYAGTHNTAIGTGSLPFLTTGSYNIGLGAYAGNTSLQSTSNNCIFIGRTSNALKGSATTGIIRIGALGGNNPAVAAQDNEFIIGNCQGTGVANTTTLRPVTNANIDLGTSTAKYKDIYYDGILQSGTLNIAPASATATGTTGEIRFTADYIYVCVATNTWKRTAISTW